MKTEAFVLCVLLLRFLSHFYADEHKVSQQDNGDKIIINVGVIVDAGSWVGKVVESCITMAVQDFYNQNMGYRTRIALQVRDSGGDSLHCIAAALDLLENVEVHAIIIPKVSKEEFFLARLVDKANVPLLSLSSIPSSNKHPYLIQFATDENNQFYGISAFLQAFKWRRFVFLYEDTADARQAQTYIHDILQENHLDVAYQTALSLQATDDQIIEELHKVMMMRFSIILVHLSPSLASHVFINAKMLGMMSKGFGWIVTSKAMNFLDALHSSVYESTQGVIGFKSYVSKSSEIQNLTSRWRREFHRTEPDVEIRELNTFGVWAYNAAWALAEAIESAGMKHSQSRAEGAGLKHLNLARLRVSSSGSAILSKIRSIKSGEFVGKFQLPDIYEILNIIGRGERRVGFWKSEYGLTKELNPIINSSSNFLDTIIWPGSSSTAPESWLVQMNGKSFRIGIPANARFPELVHLHHDQQRNITIPRGFCIDVFHAAVDRLPYEISFEYIYHYGCHGDLVHQVHLQKYDAAVGDITILSNRSAYVDFTLPYTDSSPGVVVKLDDKDPWFFLKPLQPDLWITIACFFFLTGFIVWLVEHPINEEFQGPLAQQIGTALWFAASTLVYAHREKLRSNVSKFVVSVWLFVVLILTSSYTAKLSSLLTVEEIKLSESDYIGYPANSLIRASSVSNLNFKDNRLKPFQSHVDYDKALRQGRKKGGVDAILDELPYLKIFVARYPHEYTIIESSMRTSGFGFAFPKGSSLVHDISRAIAELREEGTLLQLETKWDNFFVLFLLSGISKSIAVLVVLFFLLRETIVGQRKTDADVDASQNG
ncbi:Glutamate-gated kainate-type ion channel receptor subunit GluR5 [Handroanthus impetiginosus]|uniref:Glutamate receptor n=1 Tax=Handroanthus impetiginosus TaxID=429701 RepID=A0A2G9HFV1_9LAMI|nr:Glutamate-gated kainate-type ion channel receptor subunit GluR5 [Handroanthus impetiginosus]